MTGICPQCKTTYRVPSTRGSKVSDNRCPACKVPLQGRGAGVKRAKYRDLLNGGLFIFADGDGDTSDHYVRLAEPMILAPWEPRPAQSWDIRPPADSPNDYEQRIIDRAAGKVLGPGCVVGRRMVESDERLGRRWPYLIPAPDGFDPAALVASNGPVRQAKCKGCGSLVLDTAPRPVAAWTPARTGYYHRRRWVGTNPGPHPENSPACNNCFGGLRT